MATIATKTNNSLITRGGALTSFNKRSINLMLTQLFQRYSIALNKATGGKLFGATSTRQLQDVFGIPIQYEKGSMVFKNSIDKLDYLLKNRQLVSQAIGVSATDINQNRRNLNKLNQYLALQDMKYDLGNVGD